jgi:hypothetical protein
MGNSPYTPDEIVERGKAIYDQHIRPLVEADHRGDVVVIDVDTGDYEVDHDHLTAAKRARAKHPHGSLFAIRVGFPALARIGGRSTLGHAE